MGQTISQLSKEEFPGKPVFPGRFVIEICEKVHVHDGNVRRLLTIHDFVNMAEGYRDALNRWKKRGCPGVAEGKHIELCRKKIISEVEDKDILVNHNKNLYKVNEGSVFAEGADFYEDDGYIHLKIGAFRVELSMDQFKSLAKAIGQANEQIESSGSCSVLQET